MIHLYQKEYPNGMVRFFTANLTPDAIQALIEGIVYIGTGDEKVIELFKHYINTTKPDRTPSNIQFLWELWKTDENEGKERT